MGEFKYKRFGNRSNRS